MSQAWSDFHRRFPLLGPPLVVLPEIVEQVAAAIDGHDHTVLLLGVTPVLSELGRSLVAVDRSAMMIEHVWPGNDARRRVVQADWRSMAPDGGPFTAVIGDGSFNCLDF